jgi:hypothetical protein
VIENGWLELGKQVSPLVRWRFECQTGHLMARLVAFIEESGPTGGPSS